MFEEIDDLTNGLMDLIREKTGLNSDSDADDEIYSAIHNTLKVAYGVDNLTEVQDD